MASSVSSKRQVKKSFGQVCAEAAGPLAALLNHPDMPKYVSTIIVSALTELQGEPIDEPDGEAARRILNEIASAQ